MAVPFSALYDVVRTLTGNDDLDLGAEVLPDERLKVLLTTAVLTEHIVSTFRSLKALPEMGEEG